jgi:uncharacterized protein YdhG (YjbR/CyaY superfamily)
MSMRAVVDDAAQRYIEAIAPEHRALFDRVHGLIVAAAPGATVTISYGIPTYRVGDRRLYVGVWEHGLSIYGWERGHDAGFAERHPESMTHKGTLRLRPQDASRVSDDELTDLATAALQP